MHKGKHTLEWRAQGPHILPGVRGTSGVNIPLIFPQNNRSSVSGRQPWLALRPGLEHSPELAAVSGPGEPAAEVGLDPSESLMSRDSAGFCTTGPVTLGNAQLGQPFRAPSAASTILGWRAGHQACSLSRTLACALSVTLHIPRIFYLKYSCLFVLFLV